MVKSYVYLIAQIIEKSLLKILILNYVIIIKIRENKTTVLAGVFT